MSPRAAVNTEENNAPMRSVGIMRYRDTETIIPGTEIVYRETDGDSTSSQELVLIPNPTDKADDPLVSPHVLSFVGTSLNKLKCPQNWSTRWKTIVIVNQFVFVFVSILTPLSIAPLTQIFEAEFHKSIPQVNLLVCARAQLGTVRLSDPGCIVWRGCYNARLCKLYHCASCELFRPTAHYRDMRCSLYPRQCVASSSYILPKLSWSPCHLWHRCCSERIAHAQ